MRAFLKSIAMGTLAGAWMPLLLTMLLSVSVWFDGSGGGIWSLLLFAFFPLGVALAFVLPASVLIGLPLTALLQRFNAESALAYRIVGLVVGFILPLFVLFWMEAESGWWLTLFGAFSGSVTGHTWWTERRGANWQ